MKTWKQAKKHDIEVRFGGCIDEFCGFDDDRMVYVNTYNQIMAALNELPEEPTAYIKVAIWRQIQQDIPMLERIQGAFC